MFLRAKMASAFQFEIFAFHLSTILGSNHVIGDYMLSAGSF